MLSALLVGFLALQGIDSPTLTLACGDQTDQLQLVLRNAGETDTSVRLGVILANGRWHEPKELVLELTRNGWSETEELIFNSGRRDLAGRIDHWIVPLPAGSAFHFPLRSADFVSRTQPTPPEHPEALAARLTGRAIDANLNPDMGGLTVWRVWTGTITSNRLQLSSCQSRPR